jgi:ABC-type glycerol-3-phosphate transport system substrate-binding protein
MKKLLVIVLAISICLGVFTGCAGNENTAGVSSTQAATTAAVAETTADSTGESGTSNDSTVQKAKEVPVLPDGPVKLTMMGGAQLTSVCEIVLKDYLAKHPNVTIKFEKYSYAEYPTKMRLQLSTGVPTPDVLLVHDNFISQFVSSGWLMDLTDMIPEDQVLPVLSSASQNGRYYGVPNQVTIPYVFMYRKDIYDKLGLTEPKTYDEYFNQALELKKNGYYAGAVLPSSPSEPFRWYMNMLGGNVYDKDGKCVMEKGVEAINLLQKGLDAGIFHPSSQGNTDQYWAAFNKGLIAAFPAVASQAAYYETKVDPAGKGGYGSLKVAPAMKFSADGPNTFINNTEYYAINKNTKNEQAAKHLIAYLGLSEEACLKFSNVNENGIMAKYSTGYLPGIQAIVDNGTAGWKAFGGQEVVTDLCKILLEDKPGIIQKDKRDTEADSIITQVLGETFTKKKYTPEQAIEEIIKEINKI